MEEIDFTLPTNVLIDGLAMIIQKEQNYSNETCKSYARQILNERIAERKEELARMQQEQEIRR
jgi:hypothetical protein